MASARPGDPFGIRQRPQQGNKWGLADPKLEKQLANLGDREVGRDHQTVGRQGELTGAERMSASNKIVVVGGGIGGLAAALALFKEGLDVDVYEQAARLGELGAGIQISANGTRVLIALRLEEALRPGYLWLSARRKTSNSVRRRPADQPGLRLFRTQ